MTPAPLSDRVRLGFVGLGPWGIRLLAAFQRDPRFVVEWACDRDASRAQELSPTFHFSTSVEELLETPVDAVVVAVDPRQQARVALQVLEAGKHLFVEKPLALTVAEAEKIRALALERGRVVCVGHVARYHPVVLRAFELLSSGSIGRLRAAWIERSGARPRVGSTPWWVLGPHDFSLLGALEPEAFGALTRRAPPEGFRLRHEGSSLRWLWAQGDEASDRRVGVGFSSGWFAELRVSGLRPSRRASLWIGDEGALWIDEKESLLRRYAPTPRLLALTGSLAREPRPRELDELALAFCDFPAELEVCSGDALDHEIDAFARGLLEGERILTDVEDGCRVVRALSAAGELRKGETTEQAAALDAGGGIAG